MVRHQNKRLCKATSFGGNFPDVWALMGVYLGKALKIRRIPARDIKLVSAMQQFWAPVLWDKSSSHLLLNVFVRLQSISSRFVRLFRVMKSYSSVTTSFETEDIGNNRCIPLQFICLIIFLLIEKYSNT